MKWNLLDTLSDVEVLIERSYEKNVLIFKHSTRCYISKMALRNFESQFESLDCECYLLDLIRYRALSDAIAKQFEIAHQSPQLLLMRKGKVYYHVSHEQIEAREAIAVLKK